MIDSWISVLIEFRVSLLGSIALSLSPPPSLPFLFVWFSFEIQAGYYTERREGYCLVRGGIDL